MNRSNLKKFAGPGKLLSIAALGLLFTSMSAQAVPSFARQTGLTCAACHTVFPQLTPFGRQFKLDGYTMEKNSSQNQDKRLQEAQYAPLAAMLQVSSATMAKAADGSLKDTVRLPQQLSLFYAGRIDDKLGAFVQTTYTSADDHFSMDNVDIRYAKAVPDGDGMLTYGLSLNNSPTVEDVWNSTPVWGYPYASSEDVNTPSAATLIDNGLAQDSAGMVGYVQKGGLYGALGAYHTAHLGAADNAADNTNIDGWAPYFRLAWQKVWDNSNTEIGLYGISANLWNVNVPDPTDPTNTVTPVSGTSNKYQDIAADAQYQVLGSKDTVTVHATYITEKRTLDLSYDQGASSNKSDKLNTFRADATWYHNRTWGGTLAYFSTTGDKDALLYGTRTGKPDSDGYIAEADYVPWLNTKLAVQYTAYNKFDGASSNYDGSGRDAKDNNTIYLLGWFMF